MCIRGFLYAPKCSGWLIGEYLLCIELPSLSTTYIRELNQPFHTPSHGKFCVKHVVLPMDEWNMEVRPQLQNQACALLPHGGCSIQIACIVANISGERQRR